MADFFVGAPKEYGDSIDNYIAGLQNFIDIVGMGEQSDIPVKNIQKLIEAGTSLLGENDPYFNFLSRCAERIGGLGYDNIDIRELGVNKRKYKKDVVVDSDSLIYDSMKGLEKIAGDVGTIVVGSIPDKKTYAVN